MCVCVLACVCLHVCVCVRMDGRVRACVCTRMCLCARVRVQGCRGPLCVGVGSRGWQSAGAGACAGLQCVGLLFEVGKSDGWVVTCQHLDVATAVLILIHPPFARRKSPAAPRTPAPALHQACHPPALQPIIILPHRRGRAPRCAACASPWHPSLLPPSHSARAFTLALCNSSLSTCQRAVG